MIARAAPQAVLAPPTARSAAGTPLDAIMADRDREALRGQPMPLVKIVDMRHNLTANIRANLYGTGSKEADCPAAPRDMHLPLGVEESQQMRPDLDTGREKSALVQCRTAQCGALSTTRVGWLGLVYAAGCGLGGGSSWTLGGRATPTA